MPAYLVGGEVHDRRNVLELKDAAQRLDVADVTLVYYRRATAKLTHALDVFASATAKVVENNYMVPALQETETNVGTNKAGATR